MLRLYGAKLGYLLYHRISLLPRAHCMVFLSFGCAFVNILWFSKTAVPFFIIYFFSCKNLTSEEQRGGCSDFQALCLLRETFISSSLLLQPHFQPELLSSLLGLSLFLEYRVLQQLYKAFSLQLCTDSDGFKEMQQKHFLI